MTMHRIQSWGVEEGKKLQKELKMSGKGYTDLDQGYYAVKPEPLLQDVKMVLMTEPGLVQSSGDAVVFRPHR